MPTWLTNRLPWTDRIWVPDVPGPYDFMVCFHGYGMRPKLFRWGSQLDDIGQWLTDAGRPTIVYYPAGRRRNWGVGLDPWREPPAKLVDRIAEKIIWLGIKYNGIGQHARVYYLGFSKGAFFAGYLPRYSERLWWPDAVVMYAGGHVGNRVVPEPWKYPVMLIRGTDDKMVPYEPQRALTEAQKWYLDHGHPVSVLEPEGERHEWDEKVNPQVLECLKGAGR